MITAVVVEPDGSAEISYLPSGLDFLEVLYEVIGTDIVDYVSAIPGALTIWTDDIGQLRDPVAPNDVATALLNRIGTSSRIVYGTAVFTGGLDTEGALVGLSPATAKQLLKRAGDLAVALNLREAS